MSFDLGARMTQFFVGGRIANTAEQAEERRQLDEASYFAPGDPVSLVIVDVIWLDGESLLDVPLLERKRQLESIIEASDLIRLGAYVRPPIETWIGSWRAVGFRDLSFRGANSRYRPGAVGDDWATVPIPRRWARGGAGSSPPSRHRLRAPRSDMHVCGAGRLPDSVCTSAAYGWPLGSDSASAWIGPFQPPDMHPRCIEQQQRIRAGNVHTGGAGSASPADRPPGTAATWHRPHHDGTVGSCPKPP